MNLQKFHLMKSLVCIKILNLVIFQMIVLSFGKGMRAPDLQNGGDLQLTMMKNENFLYDASYPTLTYGGTSLSTGLWPYSFDYKSIQVGR